MKSGYFTPDIEQFVPEFFIDLEKEINSNEEEVTLIFFSVFLFKDESNCG